MEYLKRILLVEDDPNDIELTISALKEHNLANDVVIAHDGLEGLDYLYRRGNFAGHPEGNPVVIMLDLKLPKLNGLQVLEKIKSDARFKAIPIVILTSSRQGPDLEEAYRLGANAYVVKPVIFTEFVQVVKEIGVFWALVNEPPPDSFRRE